MSSKLKLLTEWAPFEYNSEMIKESKEANNGKILMKGILQKAETLNQNGRIYPRAILEREVRNYQKFIKEARALGECCLLYTSPSPRDRTRSRMPSSA